MKTLLITAFEPFGGESENPSALALELLPETIGGIRLEKRLLEVTFLGAKDAVCRHVDEIKPDYAICLGQAGGRFAITPERVAINVMDARIADNAGYKPEDEPVVTGGANAHFATLPIKRMVSAMERANVAAAVSNSAGTYVCNSTMYALLDHIAANSMATKAGFIHVPYIPSQAADKPNMPSMPLEDIVKGLHAAIECIDE